MLVMTTMTMIVLMMVMRRTAVVQAFSTTASCAPTILQQQQRRSLLLLPTTTFARLLRLPSSTICSSSAAFPSFLSRRTALKAAVAAPPDDDNASSSEATTTITTTTTTTKSPTLPWSTDTVRSTFIDYFRTLEDAPHTYQPSSPCAPLNDPTLLFTNAGMNQFKPIFLGQVDPSSPLFTLKRAVNSQKCIRAGGKHNDLEDVGRDTYHHTFFEMLGTWSFGDYFKTAAIDYAWRLLTQVYGLNPDRLYATYFQGDESLPPDTDARDHWRHYLPDHHILPCSARDNFWEMGDTGPCGPCTEIHYDRIGGGRDASKLVNADDPDVIEIWNIVFIQYNRDEGKILSPLPAQHIDTGMGLERLVSILQQKSSNYDIDAFAPLLSHLEKLSPVGPYHGRVGDAYLVDTAYRAVVDHIRTLCFAMADGAVPNNEGRGYVLRRILRRAARYGQQILGIPNGFLARMVPVVVDTYGSAFPELVVAREKIVEIVAEEEAAFATMLDRGIKYFADLQEELQMKQQSQVPGSRAFFMYDTLGFPIDLTEQMAQEAGLTVDTDGFAQEMAAQKERSRSAQKMARSTTMGGGGGTMPPLELIAEQTAYLNGDGNVLPTDDSFKYKWNVELPATVMAIFTADNGFVKDEQVVDVNDYCGIILDKSSYYAEAGGQEADTGLIDFIDRAGTVVGSFQVLDVQVYGGFLLHKGIVVAGQLQVGDHVNCKVDYDRRRRVASNHSMTHVLNAALRQVLGDAVDQRGSLCNEEKLRFDFSHKKALELDEIKRVETICQQVVAGNQAVSNKLLPLEQAKEIAGVRAVFGEVYPDPVRVVRIGEETSVEFCGGTHVANTGEAEAFVIVEETAVAKGIRRITAVTKEEAKTALANGGDMTKIVEAMESIDAAEGNLDTKAGELRKYVDASIMSASLKAELRARIEAIQKKAADGKKKALQKRVDNCLNEVKTQVQACLDEKKKFLVINVDIGADSKSAQKVVNMVSKMAPNLAFLGLSEEEPASGGKLMAFASVPDSFAENDFKADDWVRTALSSCGGRGGGKANNAQAQAKECSDVDTVFRDATAFAESKKHAVALS